MTESWNILHQVCFLLILLADHHVVLGHATESVVLVHDSLCCLMSLLSGGIVLLLHELTEIQSLTGPIMSTTLSSAASTPDGLDNLLVVEIMSETSSSTKV